MSSHKILEDLSLAAAGLERLSNMINSSEDPPLEWIAEAQLTGISGCFTTLVQIAASLHNIEASLVFARLGKNKETMQ